MWARPDSAQKGWADLGPTVLSASLVWACPSPDIRARLELSRPRKGRGGIIFPFLSSCMQKDILFACRRR
jgi:hypothetical protein